MPNKPLNLWKQLLIICYGLFCGVLSGVKIPKLEDNNEFLESGHKYLQLPLSVLFGSHWWCGGDLSGCLRVRCQSTQLPAVVVSY